jgi:hypothetical protein
MKNNSYSALHVICGSITNVALENGNFIVNVQDKYVYEHLTEKTNFNLLKRAFVWQDLNLELIINISDKQSDPNNEDIEKLKSLVGEYLIVQENEENNY